jgi:hypothetical protein
MTILSSSHIGGLTLNPGQFQFVAGNQYHIANYHLLAPVGQCLHQNVFRSMR